jgi:hypothetical protein
MTSSSDLKNHHISILYYWNKGVRSAPVIHRETNIPLRTIYYNINKLKQTNSLKHRGGNDRPRVLSEIEKKAVGQYIRCNNQIILNEIKESLSRTHHKTVSTSTINTFLEIDVYNTTMIPNTQVILRNNSSTIMHHNY